MNLNIARASVKLIFFVYFFLGEQLSWLFINLSYMFVYVCQITKDTEKTIFSALRNFSRMSGSVRVLAY